MFINVFHIWEYLCDMKSMAAEGGGKALAKN
jgi:hypothetical protein